MENVTIVMIGDIELEIVLRLRNLENNRCLLIRSLYMDNVISADLKIIGLQIVPREKKFDE